MIAEAVALALAGSKADGKAVAKDGQSVRSMKNYLQVVKTFKAKGFGDVTPHVDVLTFNRWLALGRRPVEGCKSTKIANLRLFHVSQTRAVTLEEMQAMTAQAEAAVKRQEEASAAKIVNINEHAPQ